MAFVNRNNAHLGPTLVGRSDSLLGYTEHSSLMMEKRQLFLRSYQFCRKQSLSERMKRSLVKIKKDSVLLSIAAVEEGFSAYLALTIIIAILLLLVSGRRIQGGEKGKENIGNFMCM
ncbi:conserved hypothetical protein [Ricinus communis]|uniref:Uncharacterized protein n=1 Tax=Ricinus communis TaxID=3988 RepID=B9RFT1_RICCO|nr:conserved hypothetical protein [Ricinus communis]